jgi:hypothetical protein
MLRYYYSVLFICLIMFRSLLRVLYLLEVQLQYVSGNVPDNGYLVMFQSYGLLHCHQSLIEPLVIRQHPGVGGGTPFIWNGRTVGRRVRVAPEISD